MGEIREGQKTKLLFKAAGGSEQELECSIRKIYADRISLNFSKEEVKQYIDYLREGDEMNVKIFTPSGIKMFDAIILDSPLEAEFVIEFVEDYIEIQRRKYLRMALNTKIMIERSQGHVVTHTCDLGGGGLRFFYEGSFEHKETVNCRLFLPDMPSIQIQGVIVKDDRFKANEHVLVFTKIKENERDMIIKKCFEVQVSAYKQAEQAEEI